MELFEKTREEERWKSEKQRRGGRGEKTGEMMDEKLTKYLRVLCVDFTWKPVKRLHFQHEQIEHKNKTACTSPRVECWEWMKVKVFGDCQQSWGVYWILSDHRTGDMETEFTSLSEWCRKTPVGIPVIHPPERCLFTYSKDTYEVVARQCARHYDMVMEKMKNKEDSGLSMWNLYSEQT